MPDIHDRLITDVDAREYFQGAVQSALQNQDIDVSGETVVYLGNLLTTFIYSDHLFEQTEDGVMLKSLAMYYKEAYEARTINERLTMLRRLGDISLFISGMFSQSLNRSLVDIDYYIAMGGNAYGYLSEMGNSNSSISLKIVFTELAYNFYDMTDVLSEVGESTNSIKNVNVLRLYENWQKTGSKRAANKLKAVGIYPVNSGTSRH
ncbi:MAG: hypothetical protein ACI9XC_000819 [Gammaproteobacteria bacterium]|jgi:hypothetical protein